MQAVESDFHAITKKNPIFTQKKTNINRIEE
jgi:hypothetical protein